jgi:hypothetical protein
MYYHVTQLANMIKVYNQIDCIGEILIINNNATLYTEFESKKIKTIGTGENMYVNPSWRFAAYVAKYDNLIIANDDITITGDLQFLLTNVGLILKDGVVFGPNKTCFPYYYAPSEIKFKPAITDNKFGINYGFGVFMLIKKKTFLKSEIPKDFLIWYGDHILFLKNDAWEFKGIRIDTSMRGTTSKLNLKRFAITERNAFNKLKYAK